MTVADTRTPCPPYGYSCCCDLSERRQIELVAEFHAYRIRPTRIAYRLGIDIALIIEKCEDLPTFKSKNIQLYTLPNSRTGRIKALIRTLIQLQKKGYSKIFIRISRIAALLSIITSLYTSQKIYYWKSGQGAMEHYLTMEVGYKKLKYWFREILFFKFIIVSS